MIADDYLADNRPASTPEPTNLTAGVNHVNLVGRLVPQTSASSLDSLSVLFSNYLNGLSVPVSATGASIQLPGGEIVTWLVEGISALTLDVPLMSPTGRISPIQSISINQLSLAFDPATPYAPLANSSDLTASFALPFGFSLDIVSLQNSFSIVDNQTIIGNLSAPMGGSKSVTLERNAAFTYGTLVLALPSGPLEIGPEWENHM